MVEPFALRGGVALIDQLAVDIHPHAARLEAPRRRQHDATVARAQIDDEIVLAHAGEPEHFVNHGLGRRHVRSAGELFRRNARSGCRNAQQRHRKSFHQHGICLRVKTRSDCAA